VFTRYRGIKCLGGIMSGHSVLLLAEKGDN
jgi:hypothetical protein